ncbi:MAG: hypothetical protein DMD91_31105 [Candidatus Rokuibacteriota bacterium]|nr:MAG: hypothetical protein DMD91_31105 [Candidatus Rokubacteria bacterium]
MAVFIVVLALGIPAVAFTLWPLSRRRTGGLLSLPPDAREQLAEQKRMALGALRELEFEHGAGHISDDDFRDLRARYEAEAAQILMELDRLGPAPSPRAVPQAPAAPRRSAWQHPVAAAIAAVVLVGFGVALGAGIVRHSAPEPSTGTPMPGSRPLADLSPSPATGDGPPRAIAPEVLRGMLEAARASLFAGRYGEAIAAYQAVLKRDPKNVDAMTHLALIVAIGGHVDTALESFDKALAIDPSYAPALLYRGQILYESKNDRDGAIRSWERFIALVPSGEDHDRVAKMIEDAKRGAK